MHGKAASMSDKSYIARMSPALNGSSTLQRFERGNTVKIRNGIMFDFYPGLPHIYVSYVVCPVYTPARPCGIICVLQQHVHFYS